MAKYNFVTGTNKNDWLQGSEVHDDIIYAYDGNDYLFGFGGNDILIGQGGNDRLYGGFGNDKLWGGEGADYLNGGSGTDTATYETSSAGVNVNLSTNTAWGGDAQGDTFYSIENLTGSRHGDTLKGNSADNLIKGMDGNDTIYGYGGNDRLEGGDGIDFIRGGEGNDTLIGGDDADTLIGGADNDTFIGGDGADAHYGDGGTDTVSYENSQAVIVDLASGWGMAGDAAGDTYFGIENVMGSNSSIGDIIIGNNDDNVIHGLDGSDFLTDGGGDDTVYGGSGNDIFFAGEGSDDYFGGADSDTIDYSASDSAVKVYLFGGYGDLGYAAGDTYDGIENATGSQSGDILFGDSNANILKGGGSTDLLSGFDGDDTLEGGAGGDLFYDFGGNDVYTGDDGSAPGYADTFFFVDRRDQEADIITDFEVGVDTIDFTRADAFTGFNDLNNGGDRYMEQADNGVDTVIHYYDHTITLLNVDTDDLSSEDFLFA